MASQAARELVAATVWLLHEGGGSNSEALANWWFESRERYAALPPIPGVSRALAEARASDDPLGEIRRLLAFVESIAEPGGAGGVGKKRGRA